MFLALATVEVPLALLEQSGTLILNVPAHADLLGQNLGRAQLKTEPLNKADAYAEAAGHAGAAILGAVSIGAPVAATLERQAAIATRRDVLSAEALGGELTLSEKVMATETHAAEGGGPTTALAPFDPEFATRQLLGVSTTPGGKQINFHAADRMVNPPKGRVPMSVNEVEHFVDTADSIKKIKITDEGTSVTLMNSKYPKAQVAVDGNRIITVVNPRRKK